MEDKDTRKSLDNETRLNESKSKKSVKNSKPRKPVWKIAHKSKHHGSLATESHQAAKELPIPVECTNSTARGTLNKRYGGTGGKTGVMNLSWFSKQIMSQAVQKSMSYTESLLMVNESGTTVGKMYNTVSESKWGETHCLCVHSGSNGKFENGLECGTTITGFVSSKFHTLQEYVHDWAKVGKKTVERKIFLSLEDEILHCRVIVVKGGEVTKDHTFSLNSSEMDNVITESASIVLQRYMVKEKRTGEFDVGAMTVTGKVVTCNYSGLGNGVEQIKGENLQVWGIRRTIFYEAGKVQIWDSLFNSYGRLVLRCQPDNDHALVQHWFEAVNVYDSDGSGFGIRPPLLWACDAELYSKYLIKKKNVVGEYQTYLQDHPEIRAIVSDFLQSVLLQKPTAIVSFAINYFESWLPYRQENKNSLQEVMTPGSNDSESQYDGEDGEGEGQNGSLKSLYPVPPFYPDGISKDIPLEDNNEFYLDPKHYHGAITESEDDDVVPQI